MTQAIEALCPACSMCCNGVLFEDVRLQGKDDPKMVQKLGLRLERHGRGQRVCQPCGALQGGLCQVYGQRPVRCRSFECRLLKNVQAGQTPQAAALKVIRKTRQQADKVIRLLEQLGNTETTQPLTRRYEEVMSQPWDLSAGKEFMELRAKLMREMSKLMSLAETEFLT